MEAGSCQRYGALRVAHLPHANPLPFLVVDGCRRWPLCAEHVSDATPSVEGLHAFGQRRALARVRDEHTATGGLRCACLHSSASRQPVRRRNTRRGTIPSTKQHRAASAATAHVAAT